MWFNAPHGPWETLHSGETPYAAPLHLPADTDHWAKHRCPAEHWVAGDGRSGTRVGGLLREDKRWQYKTMVSW